jgi:hypothetical protein
MNCPHCCSSGSSVSSEIVDAETVIRQRQCKCGFKWVTAETFITTSVRSIQAFERNSTRVNAVEIEKNAGLTRVEGGGGVSVSGSDLVLLPSDPSQQSGSGARAIRRGRPDLAVYPTEFEVLWAAARKQGKCGNKLPAFKSWERLNADDHLNALILTRFEEWAATDQWKRGFNPHFVTWLNQRGWEESPTAKDMTGPDMSRVVPGATGSAAGPSQSRSDYCVDHVDGNRNRWSSMPTASCPECRHQRARYPKHERSMSMDELFGKGA